jgi:vacuolar iron transporter family protein
MAGAPVRHVERHFTGGATVRDLVIGMSDGLTVPFALAAGLSGAVQQSFVVLVAGIAELAAGSIAMGLGGFLAARAEADTYRSELARERREVHELPEVEAQEVRDVFAGYGLQGQALESAVQAVRSSPEGWVRFMMRDELGLEEPDPQRAPRSALTIGLSYVAGGLVPLAPYALGVALTTAFVWSIAVTLLALLAFGAAKAHFTGMAPLRGAVQTTLVGAVAAAVAYILARLVVAWAPSASPRTAAGGGANGSCHLAPGAVAAPTPTGPRQSVARVVWRYCVPMAWLCLTGPGRPGRSARRNVASPGVPPGPATPARPARG